MEKVNFKIRNVAIAVIACLAVTMMTACGGGSSNKNAAQQSNSEKTEAPVKKATESNKWPDNHFTKQVPKLDFAINTDGVDVSETSTMIRFSDSKPTKEQIRAYWGKIKAAGFTNNVMEADDEFGISFTAENAAGYRVRLTDRSITIKKE